jgi:hypothetical protein
VSRQEILDGSKGPVGSANFVVTADMGFLNILFGPAFPAGVNEWLTIRNFDRVIFNYCRFVADPCQGGRRSQADPAAMRHISGEILTLIYLKPS